MTDDKPLPQRKYPSHPSPVERANEPIVLFVTVTLADKSYKLASEESHKAILQAWECSDQWNVGSYMIMPDHLHFFCIPGVLHPLGIERWCKYWKGQYRRICNIKSTIWQMDCWDTQVRSYDHYVEKAAYVRMNPVRKKLVDKSENWPYQGEIKPIRW